MYVFLSENPSYVDYDPKYGLIWEQNGLVYGDWSAGIYGDGSYTKEVEYFPNSVMQKY